MDLRKLRCAICRLNFRERGIRTVSVKITIHERSLKLGDQRCVRFGRFSALQASFYPYYMQGEVRITLTAPKSNAVQESFLFAER